MTQHESNEAPTVAQGVSVGLSLNAVLGGGLLIAGEGRCGKSWAIGQLMRGTSGVAWQVVLDAYDEHGDLGRSLGHTVVVLSPDDLSEERAMALASVVPEASLVLQLGALADRQIVEFAEVFLPALIGRTAMVRLTEQPDRAMPGLLVVEGLELFSRLDLGLQMASALMRLRPLGVGCIATVTVMHGMALNLLGQFASLMAGYPRYGDEDALAIVITRLTASLPNVPMPSRPGEFLALGPAFQPSPAVFSFAASIAGDPRGVSNPDQPPAGPA